MLPQEEIARLCRQIDLVDYGRTVQVTDPRPDYFAAMARLKEIGKEAFENGGDTEMHRLTKQASVLYHNATATLHFHWAGIGE